jgi:hypothetical protein
MASGVGIALVVVLASRPVGRDPPLRRLAAAIHDSVNPQRNIAYTRIAPSLSNSTKEPFGDERVNHFRKNGPTEMTIVTAEIEKAPTLHTCDSSMDSANTTPIAPIAPARRSLTSK